MQLSNEKILVNIELVFSRKKEKKKYIYTIKFFRLEYIFISIHATNSRVMFKSKSILFDINR